MGGGGGMCVCVEFSDLCELLIPIRKRRCETSNTFVSTCFKVH